MTDSPINLLWSVLAFFFTLVQHLLILSLAAVVVAAGALVLLFVSGLAFANWVIEEVLP